MREALAVDAFQRPLSRAEATTRARALRLKSLRREVPRGADAARLWRMVDSRSPLVFEQRIRSRGMDPA